MLGHIRSEDSPLFSSVNFSGPFEARFSIRGIKETKKKRGQFLEHTSCIYNRFINSARGAHRVDRRGSRGTTRGKGTRRGGIEVDFITSPLRGRLTRGLHVYITSLAPCARCLRPPQDRLYGEYVQREITTLTAGAASRHRSQFKLRALEQRRCSRFVNKPCSSIVDEKFLRHEKEK